MKSCVLLGVVLCLCVASQGSPLKGTASSAAERYFKRIKEEANLRVKNNKPLTFTSEGKDGTARIVDHAFEVESLSTLPLLDYTLNVDFYLFKKKNNEIEEIKIPMDAEKILGAGFQKTYETKIIIHGFSNDLKSPFIQDTSRTYAEDFNLNVIAVDWGKISNQMLYPTARYHVEGVGQYVAQLLSTLRNASLLKPNGEHLIGHSLGAHVAGYAGKSVKKEGWTITRITGLDPAGPLFNDPTERLTKDDAAKVDVIHTCAKTLGIAGNIGHIDFYPNGGEPVQPGCHFDVTGTCSHGRSFEFFIESIKNPKAFIGKLRDDPEKKCNYSTTAVMGAWLSYQKEGAYDLPTEKCSPFGLGENGVC